jgi:hypothetical protein
LGPRIGAAAEEIVVAFATDREKAVKDRISRHRKEFEAKSADERSKLAEEAAVSTLTLILKAGAVERDCPACGSKGVLTGKLIGESVPVYEDGYLFVKVEYLVEGFRCFACGLNLASVDEVGIAGMDLHFTETKSTSLHENFQPEWEDEYENM